MGLEQCRQQREFGSYNLALSLEGDYLAFASLSGGSENQGFVRVFRLMRDSGDIRSEATRWEEVGGDIVGNTRNGLFGASMAFDVGKVGIRLAVSSPVYDGSDGRSATKGPNTGKVEIFELDLERRTDWYIVGELHGSVELGSFGSSISFSLDGQRLAVGSTGVQNNAGRVEVFEREV